MAFIPGGIAGFSLLASGAGAGVSALGALGKGAADARQLSYLAAVSRANSQIAKQNAAYERSAGEVKAANFGIKSAFQQGSIEAAQGASGLSIAGGSAQAVQRSQKLTSAQDMATIRSNAARLAYGYDIQASQHEQQALIYDEGSSQAKKSSYLNAFGSLIGGATSVSSKWLQGQSLGMWGSTGEDILFAPDDI